MTKGPKTRIGAWLARPLASFHLVVTIATMLTVLGLVMVLSASSVEQYVSGGSAYSLFTQQLIFAILGAVLFYVALRDPGESAPAVFVSAVRRRADHAWYSS